MAISQNLTLKQGQSLVMTPQLQQAIKLLQLSNVELSEYIERELEKNPLLERDDSNADARGPAETASSDTPAAEGAEAASAAGDAGGEAVATGAELAPLDDGAAAVSEIDDNWQGRDDTADAQVGASVAFENWGSGGSRGFDGGEDFDLENRLTSEESLRDRIVSQVNIELDDPSDRMIAFTLMENLDEAGYLRIDLDQIAERMDCPLSHVEGVVRHLQGFEPTGIFARDLKECLTLQLAELKALDGPMMGLLDNLELLASGDLNKLVKVCRVSQEILVERVRLLRSVDPKPASKFNVDAAQVVTPDVLLRPNPAGGWIVELNPDNLPRVLVNNIYSGMVTGGKLRKEDRDYLNEQMQTANWLVKALHQRAQTIMKVASTIVERQELFFTKGVQYLKPLILRDISEAVDIHESTVSRATTNKYISTPRGMFELKYFFTASIAASGDGEAHSAEAVRHRIKALVDAEQANAILSDDTIVDLLREDGVDIARRTVAKYREALRIPSSVKRRRLKAMA